MIYVLIEHIPFESSDIVSVFKEFNKAVEEKVLKEKEQKIDEDVKYIIEPHEIK